MIEAGRLRSPVGIVPREAVKEFEFAIRNMSLESRPFEQELPSEKPPIMAVGGVVYRRRAGQLQLLLIKKRHGFWTLPKGRVEPGETEGDAVVREVHEETGIGGAVESAVRQVCYTVQKAGRPRLKIVTYYIVRGGEGTLRPDVGENIQFVRWFPIRAALRRIRPPRVRWVARAARVLLEVSGG